MTGPEVAQIILASATFLTALGGVISSLFNRQKIAEVHALTNSLADKRDAATQKSAFAEGVLAEKGKTEAKSAHDSAP